MSQGPILKVSEEFQGYLSLRPRSDALSGSTCVSQGLIPSWKKTGHPQPPRSPLVGTHSEEVAWRVKEQPE